MRINHHLSEFLKIAMLFIITLNLNACQKESGNLDEVSVKLVKTMVVSDPRTQSTRHYSGKVLANQTAELSFEVSGQLITFDVNEGDAVEVEQLLASLDPKKFTDRLNEKQARYNLEKTEVDRGRRLKHKDYISQAHMDILEAEYQIAKANLEIAQFDLEHSVLYAPFAGIIARKHVDNFERVEAKQSILILQDISNVDIEIHIPEHIVAHIQKGDVLSPVAIFDVLPDVEFFVSVKEFSSQADPDTQTYKVVFTLPAPEGINIFPGMSVAIKVLMPSRTENIESYYIIPVSAVFVDEDDQPSVWLIDPDLMGIQKTPIEVSSMSDQYIKVITGISPGDKIVAAGAKFLHEGDIVRESDQKTK